MGLWWQSSGVLSVLPLSCSFPPPISPSDRGKSSHIAFVIVSSLTVLPGHMLAYCSRIRFSSTVAGILITSVSSATVTVKTVSEGGGRREQIWFARLQVH